MKSSNAAAAQGKVIFFYIITFSGDHLLAGTLPSTVLVLFWPSLLKASPFPPENRRLHTPREHQQNESACGLRKRYELYAARGSGTTLIFMNRETLLLQVFILLVKTAIPEAPQIAESLTANSARGIRKASESQNLRVPESQSLRMSESQNLRTSESQNLRI